MLADFIIAAHAAAAGLALVSRDAGHLRCFKLSLINPAEG